MEPICHPAPVQGETSIDLASLALKLTPPSQSRALQDPTLIPALLNSAIPGAGQNLSVEPLIPASLDETLASLIDAARERTPNYQPPDFKAWYRIKVATDADGNPVLGGRGGGDGDEDDAAEPDPTLVDRLVALLLNRDRFTEVESTHALRVQDPPVNSGPNPLAALQGYLNPAHEGINAAAAWTRTDGSGVGYVDIEPSWDLGHEDLRVVGGPDDGTEKVKLFGPGINVGALDDPENWKNWRNHGTGVLGILSMSDNDIGGVGICPGADGRVVGECQITQPGNKVGSVRAEAIAAAAGKMSAGDVLLLQMQATDQRTGRQNWPAEIDLPVFHVIELAVAAGRVVVEPAGNGYSKQGRDLDAYVAYDGRGRFLNPDDPAFKDSGAIMVTACGATVPHQKSNSSGVAFGNYGKRVNQYAWGEGVTTAQFDGVSPYTSSFDGTSAASAIVAGAAVLLQGLAGQPGLIPAGGHTRFSPAEVREILKIGGTKSAGDRVGVMPNFARIMWQEGDQST